MKAFNRIFSAVTVAIILLFAVVNMILAADKTDGSRQYRVEISRLVHEIETNGSADISECVYVTNIERYGEKFYSTDSDYIIYEINGELYRFDYNINSGSSKTYFTGIMNAALGVLAILFIAVMLYIKHTILVPFERLSSLPYELSKGNLTAPVTETKNRFFGKFLWGIDVLRENIEQQKQRELEMQKEKKMLLLSLSHDIKTPLSAIKLYSAALSTNLYPDAEKQQKVAESITEKADEIEGYVSQIITASRKDFLSLEVNMGEFYLSELIEKITGYYREKLALIKTDFNVGKYKNCLLSGDLSRSVEVLQNVMENALKYGDGKRVELIFPEDDECVQIVVTNGGCTARTICRIFSRAFGAEQMRKAFVAAGWGFTFADSLCAR